jgi:hypothetical protein
MEAYVWFDARKSERSEDSYWVRTSGNCFLNQRYSGSSRPSDGDSALDADQSHFMSPSIKLK